MSKKHFEALAAALKSVKSVQGFPPRTPEATWVTTCLTIANTLQDFNPRFDRARFLAACGVEDK
jgi:hypothetical protein